MMLENITTNGEQGGRGCPNILSLILAGATEKDHEKSVRANDNSAEIKN
jgi:hypothetical protein